jgi:hypothetical protein
MLNSIQQNIVTTLISAKDLNAQKIGENSYILIALLSFIILVILAMVAGQYLDTRSLKSKVLKISPLQNCPEGNINPSLSGLLDESLPKILSRSSPIGSKLREEFKQHHKWFCVILHFSEYFPRSLRVLSLISNIITMLFFQSIVYNLANPNDGSCSSFTTKINCERQQSQLNMQESKCLWENDPTSNGGGKCTFNATTFSWTVLIFVTLFSLMMSTPVVMFINFIIQEVLTGKCEGSSSNNSDTKLSGVKYFPSNHRRLKSDFIIIQNRFKMLCDEIKFYRENLSDLDRVEFDSKF